MRLSADSSLSFPRERVFSAYRDHLLDLVEFLPNIRRIEQRSRKDDGPRSEIVNVWHGGGDIPAAARAVLSEDMLTWTDYASWDEGEHTCAWRIETHSFTQAVFCQGKNRFVELDGATRLEIRGEIRIDATKIRGVPRLLSKTVGRAVEDLLVKKITPNLISVSYGLRRYLEAGEITRVKILYFAAVGQLLGKGEEDVDLPDGVERLAELVGWLERERSLEGKLTGVRFAINESFADLGDPVRAGDVIAVIPPVAGG